MIQGRNSVLVFLFILWSVIFHIPIAYGRELLSPEKITSIFFGIIEQFEETPADEIYLYLSEETKGSLLEKEKDALLECASFFQVKNMDAYITVASSKKSKTVIFTIENVSSSWLQLLCEIFRTTLIKKYTENIMPNEKHNGNELIIEIHILNKLYGCSIEIEAEKGKLFFIQR